MNIFSFFMVYYYYIKLDNRYLAILNSNNLTFVMMTPLAFFVASIIVFVATGGDLWPRIFIFLTGLGLIANMAMIHKMFRNQLITERDAYRQKYEEEAAVNRVLNEKLIREERQSTFYQKHFRNADDRARQYRNLYEHYKALFEGVTGRNEQSRQERQSGGGSPYSREFAILGVSPNSGKDAVRKAYRSLAKIHHPDMGGDSRRFQEIKSAYDTIRKYMGF
jgi:DnaJ-domain-containing protein 1